MTRRNGGRNQTKLFRFVLVTTCVRSGSAPEAPIRFVAIGRTDQSIRVEFQPAPAATPVVSYVLMSEEKGKYSGKIHDLVMKNKFHVLNI